jgi:dihydrofolate reductase
LKNQSGDGDELKFAKLADKTQHIVFTKSDFKPDWKNTRVAHDLPGEIAGLKKQPGKNIIAWGGANFASNLIKLGLIDELRITLNPMLLGGGKTLFGNVDKRSNIELTESVPMKSGVIVLRYKVK